jgi:hypothetical protein
MISKRKMISESLSLTSQLLRAQWGPILALFLFSTILNLGTQDAMQLLTQRQETERVVYQLTEGLWSLIEGVLFILILSWGIPKVRAPRNAEILAEPFKEPYVWSFLAEYLRFLAQVLMYGLLLVIPGFVRYWQLIFVPFIALFSRAYRAGNVDALKLSETLTRGRLPLIVAIVLVTMGVETALELAPEQIAELYNYPCRVLFEALSALINIWSFALIFVLFETYLGEEKV